ncbi:MAG: hypothetical protein ACLFTJ_02515 [Halothece sp.]
MTSEEVRIRPKEASKMLGISMSTYYDHLRFLGEEAKKGEAGKTYITVQQFQKLKKLTAYIKETGTKDGFLENEAREVNNQEDVSEKAKDDITQITKTNKTGIESNKDNKIEAKEEEEINFKTLEEHEKEHFKKLIRSAQEWKAGTEIAKYTLASQMDENDLPEDLRDKVEEVKGQTIPKSQSPLQIASDLLGNWMPS